MLEEGISAARACLTDETRIAGEKFQERDQSVRVAGIYLPSTMKAADDASGGCFARPDVEDGAASGHKAVGLAWDDRSEGRRLLSDEADVAAAEGLLQINRRPVSGKRSVCDLLFPAKRL
jgi:hypothetical protein